MTQDVKDEVDPDVLAKAQLVADQGWMATFHYRNGEKLERAFITAADFEKMAILVERRGERHKKPTLIWLKDLERVNPDWSE